MLDLLKNQLCVKSSSMISIYDGFTCIDVTSLELESSVGVLSQIRHHKPPPWVLLKFLAFLTTQSPQLESSVGVATKNRRHGSFLNFFGISHQSES